MSEADVELPSDACPTIKEVRTIVSLGRKAVKRYVGGYDKKQRLHPYDVFAIAHAAHIEDRLEIPFNQVAAGLIAYAEKNSPAAVPAVRQIAEEHLSHLYEK